MALFERLMTWHSRKPETGSYNMAADEALLRWVDEQKSEVPIFRTYLWNQSTVTFGYFQPLEEAITFARDRGLVRRWTGGGLVEHAAKTELTYTLVVPRRHPFAREATLRSYIEIHRQVASVMRSIGVSCRLHEGEASLPGGACFVRPAPGDILDAQGRKLAGAGQRRSRAGLLHQGSLQLPCEIPHDFPNRLAANFGTQRETFDPRQDRQFVSLVRELEADRYASDEWLQRY